MYIYEGKQPRIFNTDVSPQKQVDIDKNIWVKNICKAKANLVNYAWHKSQIVVYTQTALA